MKDECLHPLQRVEVWNPDKQEALVCLTNNLNLGANTVAAIFEDR